MIEREGDAERQVVSRPLSCEIPTGIEIKRVP